MALELTLWDPLRELARFREEAEDELHVTDKEAEKVDQRDAFERERNIAGIYLKEMNKLPLLSRDKEIELAKRIRLGERKMRIFLPYDENSILII